MGQKRITEFFSQPASVAVNTPPASASSFMKLPANVRRAIYGFAGIGHKARTTDAFIDLNCWSRGRQLTASPFQDVHSGDIEPRDREESARVCINWKSRIPINLLHVSHTIHDEVEKALYQCHAWGASASGHGGLDLLENLSVHAVRAMRCLFVSLTPCACDGCVVTGVCPHPIPVDLRFCLSTRERWLDPSSGLTPWTWEQANSYRRERPLDIRSSLDRRTVAQWERVCTKLARYAEPRRLSLYLQCAVKDVRTAERVARPLGRFTSLEDLGVSFGQRAQNAPGPHDKSLSSLARATVQAATYKPSFPFFDLPTELQLQVLSFSHLVHDGFDLKYIAGRPLLSRPKDDGSEEQIVEFSRLDGHHAWLVDEAFCAESGNVASRGRCHQCNAPAAYFLVSRRFRDLALELFYGRNRIVAQYNDIRWCTVGNSNTIGHRPTAMESPPLPHVLLRHVTRLTLVASIQHYVGATANFTLLVELLSAHARLPSLTLELHTRDLHSRGEVLAAIGGIPVVHGRARRQRRHAEIYRIIVRQIRQRLAIRGLKAFMLYMWWEGFDPDAAGDDVATRRALERQKEKEIMGAGYDSERWGKELQRKAFPRARIYSNGWN
ncbi:hypothetical protein B0T25DRAFT_536126 [Lasiosphaeria hispida]|uniref:F-box domain-containing protein n=1 Tax=Lasiosphaeria hispida TaxID=260671 RepID=A0AAJ0HSU0_9PEZI|nr:hypothetical protein B0T25DRAFT_536126 [Lasiosphaeria hispida]